MTKIHNITVTATLLLLIAVTACQKLPANRDITRQFIELEQDARLEGWWRSEEGNNHLYFDCGSASLTYVYDAPASDRKPSKTSYTSWYTSNGTLHLHHLYTIVNPESTEEFTYRISDDGMTVYRTGAEEKEWLKKITFE